MIHQEQESLHSRCPSTSQVQPKSFSNRRCHRIYHNHNRRFNNKVFSNNHPQKNPFSIWGKARIRSSKCHRWLHSKIHKQRAPFNNNNRYLKLPLSAKHLLHIPQHQLQIQEEAYMAEFLKKMLINTLSLAVTVWSLELIHMETNKRKRTKRQRTLPTS